MKYKINKDISKIMLNKNIDKKFIYDLEQIITKYIRRIINLSF